jgi:hypothetical protein
VDSFVEGGQKQSRRRNAHALAVLALAAVFLGASINVSFPQGTVTVLKTGGGSPLISSSQTLQIGGVANPVIDFDFGFFSDEPVSPDQFLDSFTVSIEDSLANVSTLVTVDPSGTVWAPSSPGELPVTPGEIQFQAFAPPSSSPIFGQGVGYSLQVALPSSFTGSSITVDFDLFDNQNTAYSAAGWYQNVELGAAPEPPTGMLLAMGAAFWAAKRKARR